MGKPLRGLVQFGVMAAAASAATGPAVGIAAGLVGAHTVPAWLYGLALSAALLLVTWIALTRDAERLGSLGLALTRRRVREFAIGFVLSAGSYAALYLGRAALVGASWTPTGLSIVSTAVPGLAIALFLMVPEELLFRVHDDAGGDDNGYDSPVQAAGSAWRRRFRLKPEATRLPTNDQRPETSD